ncbi:hypothetical protein [Lutibacter citreus]|uniref:hypothetical protein n=1 Tax=Lutibacter citreus TaxID=2138210 RepID=UPI000DBE1C85|nr:hypothetical protein [Lutibacter citreus]
MNYKLLEKELKKRTKIEYAWGRKQNDFFDRNTNFIYKISSFEELQKKLESNFQSKPNFIEFQNYALNRWYNFWSAKAVEAAFCEHPKVKQHSNLKDKYVDFYISEIPFDHKTTVFPKGFNKSVPYGHFHKRELIEWLYKNQSQQQRKHLKNRIFIVLVNYENDNKHWKLKAEILWLQQIISNYLTTFDLQDLETFYFENKVVKSDIIWAVK